MDILIESDAAMLGRKAAALAVEKLRSALRDRGQANLILGTGASQFEMLLLLDAPAASLLATQR